MENVLLTVLSVASGAGMGFSHYGAPRAAKRHLHPLECYAIGVSLGILLPLAVWTWATRRDWKTVWAVLVLATGAGVGTAGAYLLDRVGGADGQLRKQAHS